MEAPSWRKRNSLSVWLKTDFVAEIPGNEKIKRYIREAEDFYIAYPLLTPRMDDFYTKIREAYDNLKKIKISV